MVDQDFQLDEPQLQDSYEAAMNAGHSAAWDQDWDNAIKAYMIAIRERPEAPAAYNSLGLALLQARRLEDALRVYQRAHSLDQNDAIPLEKMADVLERMGRLKEAAEQYLAVAEIYLAQHDLEKAISNWERATRVTPGLVKIHQRLAVAYERTGNRRQAVREYLTLAGNFQRANKNDIAIQAVERALRLEPKNPQALNALQALRSGSGLIAELTDERLRSKDEDRDGFAGGQDDDIITRDVGEAHEHGPIGETTEHALEELATYVFGNDIMMQPSGMNAIQGIEAHRQEAFPEAVGAYQRAESAGLHHPALMYSLGVLMLEMERWKDATHYLELVLTESHYRAGAHHGMGVVKMRQGKVRQATTFLIKTMQLVDIGLAISQDEIGELGAVYDKLLQNAQHADEKTLEAMNERFFNLLTGTDWKQRVELTRHQLEDAITEDPDALVDVASVSPEIIQAMHRIDNYINSEHFVLAMDESFYILENEPDYLAAHLRVGQILVQMGRVHQAIEKYNNIAETYLARGNKARASEILNEVIKVAPMDIRVRQTLIELLEEDERWEDILEQYINLANAYMELADVNNARTTYNQAIQLAQRIGAGKEIVIQILHRLADVDMSRLEIRAALRGYENIKNLNPNDEKARQFLIEINYRLGDPAAAVNEMDGLLQVYAKARNGRAILDLLEKWVMERPDDEALRSRLGALYQQVNRGREALDQYNKLLELQLNRGRHQDACQTIQRILSLKPPTAKHYAHLQQQLGCA